MNKFVIIIVIVLLAGLFVVFGAGIIKENNLAILELTSLSTTMQIKSPAFEHNQSIPSKYTCDDKDVSPPLVFSDIPESTISLALIVDDPDAPAGLWVHWIVWSIGPDTEEITENSVPSGGVEGVTSFGNSGYGGPCPPDGEHRYFFKLYALDIELDLSTESDKEDLEEAMVGHVLDKAELIGLYKR